MNIEHPTLNAEHPTGGGRVYDLEERLLDYSARIIRLVEAIPISRAGNHVAGQLSRSGTSPLPNHGEAQAGESRADFIHKLKVCLKELRESQAAKADALIAETEELIRIFVRSIQTSQQRALRSSKLDVRR